MTSGASGRPALCPCQNCGCGLWSRTDDYYTGPHSSRIKSLLNSNEFIPSDEYQDFRRTHIQVTDQLDQLDEQIELLSDTIEALIAFREKQITITNEYNCLVSPVRRITDGIWARIFEEATADSLNRYDEFSTGAGVSDGKEERSSSLDVAAEPWNITHVCAEWRDIALSIPLLWSSIAISSLDSSRTHESPRWTMLMEQITRSGEHSLSVCFTKLEEEEGPDAEEGEDDDEDSEPESSSLLSPQDDMLVLLLSSSSRWKQLYLDVPHKTFITIEHLTDSFPRLKSVCFSKAAFGFLHSWPTDLPPPTFLQAAPALEAISAPPVILSTFALPADVLRWASLARDVGVASQITHALYAVPSLQNCLLRVRDDDEEDQGAVLTHEALQSLTLLSVSNEGHENAANKLLDHLTLPYLQELVIHAMMVRWHSVTTFFARSHCPITKLSLSFVTFENYTSGPEKEHALISTVLTKIPDLTDLTLRYPPTPDNEAITDALGVWLTKKAAFVLGGGNKLTVVPHLEKMRLNILKADSDFPGSLVGKIRAARPKMELTVGRI